MMKRFYLFLPLAALLFSCATAPAGPSNKELAGQARDKALSVKADVAAKDDFTAAQAVYDEAASLDAAKNKAAAAKYQEAETRFNAAYEAANAKRAAAELELGRARAAIKEVEMEAAQLDAARKGGSQ